MLEFARWKYILVGVVLAVALVFALPNLFGDDFALQIARKDRAAIDAPQLAIIETSLKNAGVNFTRAEIDDGNVMVRFRRQRVAAQGPRHRQGRENRALEGLRQRDDVRVARAALDPGARACAPCRWVSTCAAASIYCTRWMSTARSSSCSTPTTRTSGARSQPPRSPSPMSTRWPKIPDIPNGLRVLLPAGADSAAVRAALKKVQPDLGCRDATVANGAAVDCVMTAAAGARAPRLRDHLEHHHAAQSRQRARRVRAHRAATGPRPHHGAVARRAELRRGQGHPRQGRHAGIPPGRSTPAAAQRPRAARRQALPATATVGRCC